MTEQPKENGNGQFYLSEYDKLKSEQIQRLGFRDNLIYANLIAITGILAITATDVVRILLLLALPMICIVLGWTYLVNDEKISAIGTYIRYTLSDKIRVVTQSDDQGIFGWETAHRSDTRRMGRKILQLFVDEFVFILPGFVAIAMFWINAPDILAPLRWAAGLEGILLIVLGIQIFSYADLKEGK
jgi:hypothetical protein